MALKITTITIDEKGDADVNLDGFMGKGCAAITDAFERALGKSVARTKKAEFNRPCDTKTKLTQNQ